MERILISASRHPAITCRECGAKFEPKGATALFCAPVCRQAYDNRRAQRGAILYDMFMEMRYRRAGAGGIWSVMCRLAEMWRDEDRDKRELRQSWKNPRDFIEKNPFLIAKRGRI